MALADSPALWDWYFEYLVRRPGRAAGRPGRSCCASVDGVLKPVRVWAFRRGYPVKITGPDLDAQSPAVAIESVEIAHHGLALVPVPG